MVYLDNAATSFRKPPGVIHRMEEALRRYGANPGRSGHALSEAAGAKVFEARQKAADFFGVNDCAKVFFTLNCTHALNFIIKGALQQGDHVILSCFEHNSVLRPVHELWRRGVVSYSVADVVEGDDERTVKNFEALIRQDTRLIICTHASNVCGIRLPIEGICRMAHQYGIAVLVDAAQTAGVLPIDVEKMGIDYLCTAGHKGLYGPTGTGLGIVGCDRPLATLFEGGTGSASLELTQPEVYPDRMESGTVNTVGILGLLGGLEFVSSLGMERIHTHEMGLTRLLYDRLARVPGVRLKTRRPDNAHYVPVLCFEIEGMPSEEVVRALNGMGFAVRGGYHCAPLAHEKLKSLENGLVRVSVGVYNKSEEILRFAAAVERCTALAAGKRRTE